MRETIDEIIENFSSLTDWEDRYRYVIELGHSLPPYPESARDERHKVSGCVSQVWLHYKINDKSDPIMHFFGDSDAHIVRGLVYIILALYSGKKASQILKIDAEALLQKLGLNENLSPQRSNGLRSMIKKIQKEARLQQ